MSGSMARQKCRGVCGFEHLERRQLYSAGPGEPAGIAYGADGLAHVAFYDDAAQQLKYSTATPGGGGSTAAVIASVGPGAVLDPAVALDPSGRAGIVYTDAADGTIGYAHQAANGWETSVVASGGATDAHIAFQPNGQPLVSFYQPSARAIELAELDGGHWRVRRIARVGRAEAGGNGLAVDPADGTIDIVFQQASGLVKFATLSAGNGAAFDGNLQISLVERLAHDGADPTVAFEPSGLPALSYYDVANGQLRLVRDVDGRWQSTTVTPSTGHAGNPQLRFDAGAGAPRVVFSNADGNLSVATNAGEGFQITPLSLTVGPEAPTTNEPPTVTSSSAPAPPAPAADLRATAASSSEIDLSWTDSSGGLDAYIVQRGAGGTAPVPIATVAAGTSHYADTALSAAAQYTYRLGTIGADGQITYGSTLDAATPAAPAPVTPAPDPLVPVYFDTGVNSTNRAGTQLLGYWLAGGSSPNWRALGANEMARSYEIGNQTSVPPQATVDAWADHVAADGDSVPAVYDMEWGEQMQPGQIAAQVAVLQASKTRHPDQRIGLITSIDLTDPRAAELDKLIDFAVVGPYQCTYSGGAGSADPVYNLAHTTTAQFLQNYQLVLDQQLAMAAKSTPGKPVYVYVPDVFTDSYTPLPPDLLRQVFGLLLDDYRQGKINAIVAYAGFNGTTGPQGTQVWDPAIGGTYITLLNQVSANPVTGWQAT
jgi:hypothetical protein